MNALLRRRGMMHRDNKANAFVPGEYHSGDSDGGVNTVYSDGSIENTTKSLLRWVSIPIVKPITYKAGDVIEFAQDRAYESLKAYRSISIIPSRLVIANNKICDNYRSFSVTANEDGIIEELYFGNFSNFQTGRVRPILKINGEIVIGA